MRPLIIKYYSQRLVKIRLFIYLLCPKLPDNTYLKNLNLYLNFLY